MRKLAAVTGASAGLGAEFARQLAARGYDLLLIARRTDRLEQIRDQILGPYGVDCEILTADLTRDADLDRVADRMAGDSRLTLLVNNAGFGTLGVFFEQPIEAQDKMHRLHVLATMRLCHAVLPGMVERGKGAIVNVSSVAAFTVNAGSVSYCATKAWINRFTEGLYVELRMRKSPVTVQALCPGYTHTEFHETVAMDTRNTPKWMWLSANRVVRESITGVETRKLFVIPSRRYRTMLRAYALLPLNARLKLALTAPKYRPAKSD